ncbi:nuclear pore complex protein NUP98A-like [Asparagus officinalis]|nr:nuclear pore complex protein NUP98A-like [Asparagus officinalis]
MSVYKDKSHEELRWEDYQRGDKGGPNYAGQFGAAVNFPSSEKANPFRLTSSNSSYNQTSPSSSIAQDSVNPSFNRTNTFSTPGLSSFISSSSQKTTFSSFAQNTANPSFNFTTTFATPGLTCANPFPQTSSNSLSNQTPAFSQFTQNNANPSFNHTPTFTTSGLNRANPSAETSINSSSNQTPTFSQFQQNSANTSFNFKPTFSTSGQTGANPSAHTSSNSSFNETFSFPFSKEANPGGQTSTNPFATDFISSSNSVSCLPFSMLPSSFSSTSSTLNGVSTISSPFDTSSTPSIMQTTSPIFLYFIVPQSPQFTTPPSSFSSISSTSIATSTPFTTSLQFPMASQWNSGQTNPSTLPASQVASAAQTSSYVIPTHPASSTSNCEFKAPQGLFAQLPNTKCNMVTEPVSTANPWGTLPAPPRIFSGQRGSEHVQYGISSMPVAEKSTPTKTSSLSALRHLSQRRISLPLRKYNAKVDGPKASFFMEDEGQQTSSGVDIFFKPREKPRSFVIRQSEQWPSRASIESQSIPTNENESPAGNTCMREKKQNLITNGHFHKLTDSSYINFKVYEHCDDIDTLMPKLPNTEYYTEPRIPELAAKERQEPGFCCHVKDFVIGRHGYGSIKFKGETDVRYLDLESIVQFNDREVIVYKDENMKPPVGEGLNKPAEVTLLNIKCVDKKTGACYTEGIKVEKFKEKLMKKTEEQKAEFVSFNAVKGFWKFRVKHF